MHKQAYMQQRARGRFERCAEVKVMFEFYLKSKKSKAVIVSRTANWSTSSRKIITILWVRVLTLSMLRSSRTFGGAADVNLIIYKLQPDREQFNSIVS